MEKNDILKLREKLRVYIVNHKLNVEKAWNNMKNNQICIDTFEKCLAIYNGKSDPISLTNLINMTSANVLSHDNSKFSDEEFEPSRANFYPIDEKEKERNVQNYEKAWKHHYENNMHHWNWWAYNNQKEKMPLTFVLEMCADWIAMSMVYSDSNAYEWYKKQEDIMLGSKQKQCVELILQMYYTQFDVHGEILVLAGNK